MGLSLKGLNSKLAVDEVPSLQSYNVMQLREGSVEVDTCQKMWAGLTMMEQNVCHLSVSVQG